MNEPRMNAGPVLASMQGIEFARGEWLPDREAIRTELQRLLASPRFRARPVLGRLLAYLVEGLIGDTPDRLREATIGADVFGRDRATFDPQSDAIVRVTASRLRKQLAEHYAADAQDSDLVLELRTGSYVPHVRRRSLHRGPTPQTVAVLPFRLTDRPGADDALCNGLTEDIIDALSRVSGARVIAPGSSFALAGRPQADAVRELKADYVLVGDVRALGALLKLSVRLDEARGTTLWSFACLVHDRDLAQVQDTIVGDVVETLLPHLGTRAGVAHRPRAVDPLARNLYHRARLLLRQAAPAPAERALDLAKEAIRREPEFAGAYRAAAAASYLLWSSGHRHTPQVLAQSRQFVADALRLDAASGVAYAQQARLLYAVDADWKGAEALFDRALQLEPHSAAVLQAYGRFLMVAGRLDDALEVLLRARATDPLNPVLRCEVGTLLMALDRVPQALQVFREVLAAEPDLFNAHVGATIALLTLNQLDDAQAAIDAFARCHDGHPYVEQLRARLLARRGDLGLARARLEALAREAPHAVTEVDWAEHYVTAGQFDRAFDALRRAADDRANGVYFVQLSPEFRPLHGDPRWNLLLQRLGVHEVRTGNRPERLRARRLVKPA